MNMLHNKPRKCHYIINILKNIYQKFIFNIYIYIYICTIKLINN